MNPFVNTVNGKDGPARDAGRRDEEARPTRNEANGRRLAAGWVPTSDKDDANDDRGARLQTIGMVSPNSDNPYKNKEFHCGQGNFTK
jgi:hypothetical protein